MQRANTSVISSLISIIYVSTLSPQVMQKTNGRRRRSSCFRGSQMARHVRLFYEHVGQKINVDKTCPLIFCRSKKHKVKIKTCCCTKSSSNYCTYRHFVDHVQNFTFVTILIQNPHSLHLVLLKFANTAYFHNSKFVFFKRISQNVIFCQVEHN